MALDINTGYNDTFKDFASAAKKGSAIAQLGGAVHDGGCFASSPFLQNSETANANGTFWRNLPLALAVSVAFQSLLMVKYTL